MSLKKILSKLVGARHQREVEGREPNKRLTPDEVELAFFEERERRAEVKRKLEKFRKEESNSLWGGSGILDSDNILNQKNLFK